MDDCKNTPLFFATKRGHDEVVSMLQSSDYSLLPWSPLLHKHLHDEGKEFVKTLLLIIHSKSNPFSQLPKKVFYRILRCIFEISIKY